MQTDMSSSRRPGSNATPEWAAGQPSLSVLRVCHLRFWSDGVFSRHSVTMELFALVFLVVALILIGVGIALGLVICGIAAVLLGIGVVSSSVVVGLFRRSSGAGVRAFLLQCGIIAGVPAGMLCAWLAHSIFEAYGSGWLIFLYGGLGGALGGVVIALMVDFIYRRLQRWASAKLATRSRSVLHDAEPNEADSAASRARALSRGAANP